MKLTPVRSAITRRTPERAALKKLSLNFTAVVMSASPSTEMTHVPASGASSRTENDAVWIIADALPVLNESKCRAVVGEATPKIPQFAGKRALRTRAGPRPGPGAAPAWD